MLWIKAFHVIFMVTWFAGLFYLPRLYVYHALCKDEAGNARFKTMERKLFFGIMTPGGVLTIIFGLWLIHYNPISQMQGYWFHAKMLLVALLIIFHIYCGYIYYLFKNNKNPYTDVFYRWLNEIPTVLLIAIIILAFVHPF